MYMYTYNVLFFFEVEGLLEQFSCLLYSLCSYLQFSEGSLGSHNPLVACQQFPILLFFLKSIQASAVLVN